MKKNNKQQYSPMPKFIMTITIILMVGTLFGAVGYLAARIPCGCVIENKPLKKLAGSDINNWKTYEDEKYNFQVKYPADISDPVIGEKENTEIEELQKEINFNIKDNSKISIYVWNMEASKRNDLAEAKEKYDEVSIGGNYGWQSKQNYEAYDKNKDPLAVYSLETYLYSKTHIYQIEYRGVYSKENFDLYQNIVLTFKLTEKDETADWQIYRNEEYGFEVALLDSWKGYSILTESWSGTTLDGNSTQYQGPKIIIRNPKWSINQPWQDIPVLVFTKNEWQLIEAENLGIFAAPIGPSKLSENQKYVFALPPRWVGFDDALGQDEAEEMAKTARAIPFRF